MDRLFSRIERLRAVGRQIFRGIAGIDRLDEKSCTSVSAVVKPQAILSFWPSSTTGSPGTVAPLSEPSGVTIRERYQRIGAPSSRCGSLARIGLPVTVRDPATTHSFDAPRRIPMRSPIRSDALVERVLGVDDWLRGDRRVRLHAWK